MLFNRQKVNCNSETENISFIIMHDNFDEYNWSTALPKGLHTISIFEAAENSFSKDVMAVFIEILEKLADSCFTVYKIEKNSQMHTGKGALFRYAQDEKHLYKIGRGIDAALLWLQIDPAARWDETEIYCCTTPLTYAALYETADLTVRNGKNRHYGKGKNTRMCRNACFFLNLQINDYISPLQAKQLPSIFPPFTFQSVFLSSL